MKQLIASIIILITFRPCAAQWQTNTQSDKAFAFGVHDTSLFASFLDGSTGLYYVARYVPTGSAFEKWSEADGGIDFSQGIVTSFASLGEFFFAGMQRGGGAAPAYRSSDNGSHWIINAAGPIASNGTYLFCNGVYRTTDSGVTWDSVAKLSVTAFGASGRCVLAATSNALWRSVDSGKTWDSISVPITGLTSFAYINSITFASNGSGTIIKSTDSGKNWTQITIPRRTITALVDSGRYLFAGTDSGVFISIDSGSSWKAESDGLGTYLKVNALCIFDTFLFVSAASGGNWYTGFRPIREMTDTTSKSAVVAASQPSDTLSIYPNPAAGVVTILSGGVAIEHVIVMEVLGENVLDLPNLRESEITLDISKIPSGTYILQITTEGGSITRRVVVMH